MVEPQSSKLITRVRFPSSPPYVDYPASIAIDAKGALIPTDERFDAACTWELGSQLYSGAWELNVQTDPPGGDHLLLDWIRPLGEAGCLMHSVGDPDSSAAWKLCPETD